MTTLGWIIAGLVGLFAIVLVISPSARKGVVTAMQSLGALIGIGGRKTQNAAVLKEQLRTETERETQTGLQAARDAETEARVLLEEEKKLQAKLAQWLANRDEAARQVSALKADAIDDAEQKTLFDEKRAIGEMAMRQIESVQAEIDAMQSRFTWARDIIAQSEELYMSLPEEAAARLREGNVAAATIALSKAQELQAKAQTAHSDSASSKALKRMNDMATQAKASAQSAQNMAIHAPSSAETAARQLRRNSVSSTSFDDFVAAQAAPSTEPAA